MGGATVHVELFFLLISSTLSEKVQFKASFSCLNILLSAALCVCVQVCLCVLCWVQRCSISDLESGVGAWHSHQAQYGLSAAPHTLPNPHQPHPHGHSLDMGLTPAPLPPNSPPTLIPPSGTTQQRLSVQNTTHTHHTHTLIHGPLMTKPKQLPNNSKKLLGEGILMRK